MSSKRSLRFAPPLALCVALLTLSAGCSFIFVDGPPANHKKLPFFTCTQSNTLPIVDLVIGGAMAASTVGELDSGSGTSSSMNTATVAVAVGEAALFAASAIYGFGKTSACREANVEMMARLPVGPTAPPSGFAPGYAAQPQVPYDPWVSPPPGAFAAPPQPPPPAKATPVAPKPPAADDETPHSQGAKP
jgi:hypothetical protein